jgi:hypothetical protein
MLKARVGGFDWLMILMCMENNTPAFCFVLRIVFFLGFLCVELLILSGVLYHQICIVIRVTELHVELQLRFFSVAY